MKITEKAEDVLKKKTVCDHCLGRQFSNLLTGTTNEERGRIIRHFVAMRIDAGEKIDIDKSNLYGIEFRNEKIDLKKPKKCSICGDIFKEIKKKVKPILKELKKYEFDTFLVGSNPPDAVLNREQRLWEGVGIEWAESVRTEINREIGKEIERATGKKLERRIPDITILYDFKTGSVKLDVRSIFIFGRYQKFSRKMPQTRWKTRIYKYSVQSVVEKPLLKQTKAEDTSFHGCVSKNTEILLADRNIVTINRLPKLLNNLNILTYDVKKRKIGKTPISDFFGIDAKKLGLKTFLLTTSETRRKLAATNDHEVYTPSGMVPLSKLKPGDKIAVYPYIKLEQDNNEKKIILTKNDIKKIIKKHSPSSNYKKIKKELEANKLLPLSTHNKKLLILSRILGFIFGDGSIWKTRNNKDFVIAFYGKGKDLQNIKRDLKLLGFKSKIYPPKKGKKTILKDYYGSSERIFEGEGIPYILCYSKTLGTLLTALGAPVGDKAIIEYRVPNWVKNSDFRIKGEFLSSLFGSDMDKPRLDKRKHNKKSFNTPRFSINKSENLLRNGLIYMQDIRKLLSEFDISSFNPKKIPYHTRKSGIKTFKIYLDIYNNFRNLMNLFGKIGYTYCEERDKFSKYVLEYLLMKDNVVKSRKKLYAKALKLKENGLELKEIYKKLSNPYLTKYNIARWITPKGLTHDFKNIKVPPSFPNFDDWLKNARKNLQDGLIWETVDSVKEIKSTNVFDITTTSNSHTFFANGFLVSNSGREDVNVRCLGWRPFVIELINPKKRKVNLTSAKKKINKSKKAKVKDLKIVDKRFVTHLKSRRHDKTYRAVVKFGKPLENLKTLKELVGMPIIQQTPNRVLRRRVDKTRKRFVKDLKYKPLNKKTLELTVKTSAGLYVKELIHGDSGRTQPNIQDMLNNKVKNIELDVIKIHE